MSVDGIGARGVDCRLHGAERAERLRVARAEVFHAVDEVIELDGGYAFRLPPDDATARRAFGFVLEERRCCSFLTFDLTFEPERRALWLALRGGPDAKAFLDAELLPSAGVSLEPCGCGCDAPDGACNVAFGEPFDLEPTPEP